MTEPVKLVTPPTSEERIRKNVVDILKEQLARAEAGEIKGIIVIFEQENLHWGHDVSGTTDMSRAIGQLEIVKHEWVLSYIEAS